MTFQKLTGLKSQYNASKCYNKNIGKNQVKHFSFRNEENFSLFQARRGLRNQKKFFNTGRGLGTKKYFENIN